MQIDAGSAGASDMNRAHAQVRRRTAPFNETRNDPNVAKTHSFSKGSGPAAAAGPFLRRLLGLLSAAPG